ncbi:MAG TPA: FMN-dependent NADH-azoreductase [Prolixibacteraceae bacterium]|nr:FMN-dependent NADH-azoreductase [Prolixibacteraceae bacterium]
MKKILHIISSPRGGESYSIKLGNAIVDKIKSVYPGSTVKENNLAKNQFPHLDEAQIASFFTPEEFRTPENLEAVRNSDKAINEIMEADILVIGAPFYNFSIHSTLKAWIDHIARAGVTFRFTEKGYEGLVHGKKVYIAVASGGIYSDGAMQSYDFSAPYLKAILGFLGITDVNVIRVEGTAIPGIQDSALHKAISSIKL